jgi:hypothetical protein
MIRETQTAVSAVSACAGADSTFAPPLRVRGEGFARPERQERGTRLGESRRIDSEMLA